MPIQVGDRFIKFKYGYGKDNPQFKNLALEAHTWQWLSKVVNSNIRLDGGNIQRHGEIAIMTDIIFRHNPSIPANKLLARLEKLLEAEVILIPCDPDEDPNDPATVGHSDGICQFAPDGKLFVHDFTQLKGRTYARYFKDLSECLGRFKTVLMPNASKLRPRMTEKQFRKLYPEADTFNPGFGYYVNFTIVGNVVLLPVFGIEMDNYAIELLQRFIPTHQVYPIPCAELSMSGGLVNCVTATYRL